MGATWGWGVIDQQTGHRTKRAVRSNVSPRLFLQVRSNVSPCRRFLQGCVVTLTNSSGTTVQTFFGRVGSRKASAVVVAAADITFITIIGTTHFITVTVDTAMLHTGLSTSSDSLGDGLRRSRHRCRTNTTCVVCVVVVVVVDTITTTTTTTITTGRVTILP